MSQLSPYIILLAISVVVVALLLVRKRHTDPRMPWVAGIIACMLLFCASLLLPASWSPTESLRRDLLTWAALQGLLAFFIQTLLVDTLRGDQQNQQRRIAAGLSVGGIALFLLAGLATQPAFVGWSSWAQTTPLVPAAIGTLLFAILGVYAMGVAFYTFSRAVMPEVANRSAFWAVTGGVLLIAVTLALSMWTPLLFVGSTFLFGTLLLVGTLIVRYRLLDVRTLLLILLRTLAVVAFSWSVLFATLYFLERFEFFAQLELPNDALTTLAVAGVALVVAVFTLPTRTIIDFLFQQLLRNQTPGLAHTSADFSQRIARAANIEQVVSITAQTLRQVLGIPHAALILINNTFRRKDSVELIVLERGASIERPTTRGFLSQHSPIYRTLAQEHVPLGQFDIVYGPAYREIDEDERRFFHSLGTSIYIPVMAEGRLIGILAAGPRRNERPYERADIDLLTVVAQQVGIALRSARLVDDLQHLNDTMRVLNKRLEGAKKELEKLDTIKTDFITIASHELRTPLAQIRGYSDIIDSLNDAGALNPQQMKQMVMNLRKSTERMEELISAMLDVSQIDVNAMDLHFIHTSAETIVKMTLEPLRDPAAERKISIEKADLTKLPRIEADLQRMTQAFRNIVLNSIKFTPDGGKITIKAQVEPAANEAEVDRILFTIEDTGVGIAEKDIRYIFQKFYRGFDTQLHSTGIYKFMGAGPGLGLTIAKGIIEGHGGQIWAESSHHDMENPPGTRVFVRLPVTPPSGTRRVQPFEVENDATRSTSELRALTDELEKAAQQRKMQAAQSKVSPNETRDPTGFTNANAADTPETERAT